MDESETGNRSESEEIESPFVMGKADVDGVPNMVPKLILKEFYFYFIFESYLYLF